MRPQEGLTEKIAIASDHAGYALKQEIAGMLADRDLEVVDLGTGGPDSVDYPDFGHRMAEAIETGEVGRGIIICGTGIGISIAANRHPGVRAAVCHDALTARLARQHNDANVLALGARIIGDEVAKNCVEVFLETPFEGGRHQRRVDKLG